MLCGEDLEDVCLIEKPILFPSFISEIIICCCGGCCWCCLNFLLSICVLLYI